jgi:hypothetical protein
MIMNFRCADDGDNFSLPSAKIFCTCCKIFRAIKVIHHFIIKLNHARKQTYAGDFFLTAIQRSDINALASTELDAAGFPAAHLELEKTASCLSGNQIRLWSFSTT